MGWVKANIKAVVTIANSSPPIIISSDYCNAVFFDSDYGMEQKFRSYYDILIKRFNLKPEDEVKMWVENKVCIPEGPANSIYE